LAFQSLLVHPEDPPATPGEIPETDQDWRDHHTEEWSGPDQKGVDEKQHVERCEANFPIPGDRWRRHQLVCHRVMENDF
jgi:hypothetical protein